MRERDYGVALELTDHFGANETPLVVAWDKYSGKKVTIEVIDLSTSDTIIKRTDYVPNKRRERVWKLTGLDSGSYKVDIYTKGLFQESVLFSVQR